MRTFLRSLGSVVVAFIAASVVMMIVETINGRLFHPGLAKAAEGLKDPQALKALLATAPASAFLVVLFGWLLGAFVGGWLATRLSGGTSRRPALILGLLLTLAGIANHLMIPPPPWFWIVSLPGMIPAALFGGRLRR
jgi:uncharacterized membrane protein YeaQ/YmgE (transglycosylase-associated protein family)